MGLIYSGRTDSDFVPVNTTNLTEDLVMSK